MRDDLDLNNVVVKLNDQDTATRNKKCDVETYLCDPLILLRQNAQQILQARNIDLFVRPNNKANGDDIVVKSIDSFIWKRKGVTNQHTGSSPKYQLTS